MIDPVHPIPVRTKICGITSVADALTVSRAGADAVGLNFFDGPRKIELHEADRILDALSPPMTVVALVDVTPGDIPPDLLEMFGRHSVSHIQMYGAVSPETLRRVGHHGLHAIFVEHADDDAFADRIRRFLDACAGDSPAAILLDAAHDRLAGGTGKNTDWQAIRHARLSGKMSGWPPLILAGGLNPNNVLDAIQATRPWMVDVASGVERTCTHKDSGLVQEFIRAVKSAPATAAEGS